MESKIPLSEYLLRQDELNYSLPEAIITETVPLEKIRISEYQPLLKEDLEKYRGKLREEIIRKIKEIPELNEWYINYQEKEGLREFKKGKERGFGERLR